jgi:predicted nucleic acid-binding protein
MEILNIPEKAKLDAYHLSVAVIEKMDYILTWNFTHMGIETYRKLLKYNETKGYKTPLLITPEYFIEEEEKE